MTDQPTTASSNTSPAEPSPAENAAPETAPREWQTLASRERRVLGALIEKAKTTPDAYPMTLNALTNACNQKSNRSPQMSLDPDDVEDILEKLRAMGCVAEVQGSGRVAKYRHYAYDWFGVEKKEIAVLTELMLRGEQTLGELRGRAARMEPIASLGELQPVIDSLKEKELLIELTPPGRGQIVTHNLYKEKELDQLKDQFKGGDPVASPIASPGRMRSSSGNSEELETLKSEVAELKLLVFALQTRLDAMEQKVE